MSIKQQHAFLPVTSSGDANTVLVATPTTQLVGSSISGAGSSFGGAGVGNINGYFGSTPRDSNSNNILPQHFVTNDYDLPTGMPGTPGSNGVAAPAAGQSLALKPTKRAIQSCAECKIRSWLS